ncbi:solute carrier family 12 member 7-like isoform X1 [Lates japonicus]|uniref:Solute carrier family 12 member 7-like isoform X1 n=1 Tax=Lates japonicus TaxID=270547 RepID=A0AAD3REU1_LATJO|nr:solute carrier family 12 member 7-like isoform X1 [Lates japonicus]
MPTNFTVVPVEDSEDASNSAGAAEGSKPISLGKIFGEEVNEDNSQEPQSGDDSQRVQAVYINPDNGEMAKDGKNMALFERLSLTPAGGGEEVVPGAPTLSQADRAR